jgi:site-specific recombinase XerD
VSKKQKILSQTSNFDSISYYIEGFLLKQRSQRSSPETIKYYQQKLGRFTWFIDHEGYPPSITELTPNHIRAFLVYLQEQDTNRWGSDAPNANRPLSAWGIHGFARAVRAFFHWACNEGDIPNPFDKIEMPKLPDRWRVESFTDEEIAAMFAACDRMRTEFIRQRNRTILAVLLDSGIRASELIGLTVDSISPQDGLFTVIGKGEKTRDVVIGGVARRELWVYLRDYRQNLRTSSNALFLSQGGTPLTYWGLTQVFKKIKQYSGITRVGVHAHVCRHSYGTLAHRNGMRGSTLQAAMGHSSFDVTRRYYLDIPKEALAQEHEKYGPLDNLRADIRASPKRKVEASKELNEMGRWVPVLPDPDRLLIEVRASSYREVARRYGVTDMTIRNRLKKAGLLQ